MRLSVGRSAILGVLSLVASASLIHPASAQARVDSNVVFGLHAGLALLMDVHYPDQPNGYGIVQVPGGLAVREAEHDVQLKEWQNVNLEPQYRRLVAAGYTVFVINHRAPPLFPYPAGFEDVQRAVRFVRYHAADYGIHADRIGLTGGSAGGHLAGMTAMIAPATDRDTDGLSEIERQSARVQTAVLGAAPTDIRDCANTDSLVCRVYRYYLDYDSMGDDAEAAERFAAASPIAHVSSDDPPTLLIHGDQDEVVPYEHAPKMKAALKAVGVPVRLLRVRDGDHDYRVPASSDDNDDIPEEVFTTIVEWFDRYLIVDP